MPRPVVKTARAVASRACRRSFGKHSAMSTNTTVGSATPAATRAAWYSTTGGIPVQPPIRPISGYSSATGPGACGSEENRLDRRPSAAERCDAR